MSKALRITKAVITLLIAVFLVMVVWGIYTALNTAPAYTLSQSEDAPTARDTGLLGVQAYPAEVVVAKVGDQGNNTEDQVVQEEDASDAVEQTPSSPVTPCSPQTSPSSPSSSSAPSGNSGSSNSTSPPANNSGSSSAPHAPSTPAPTYHPAWDEWVEEGHWVTEEVPATYAQREVYGSICNECGLTVSGFAMQHLKDTHHSGYHEGVTGYETYEATPARSVQVWVDTSHWVTHPEYWD